MNSTYASRFPVCSAATFSALSNLSFSRFSHSAILYLLLRAVSPTTDYIKLLLLLRPHWVSSSFLAIYTLYMRLTPSRFACRFADAASTLASAWGVVICLPPARPGRLLTSVTTRHF